MTNVEQVAIKLANKYNTAWNEQRDRLEAFYYDTSRFLKSLISEMDGDLAVLKNKEVHQDVINMFSMVMGKLLNYYVAIDPEKPYLGIERLVNWLEDKHTHILFDNLQFLIKEYIKKTAPQFEQSPNLKHSHIQSLQKLVQIGPKLKAFMNAHPLLPDPRTVSTIPPPTVKYDQTTLGPNDETKVFPVQVKDIPAE